MHPTAKGLNIPLGDKHVSIGYLLSTLTAIIKALKNMTNLSYW